MATKHKIARLIEAFAPKGTSPEELRRVALLVTLSLVGILFLMIFSIIAFLQSNMTLCVLDTATALILALNLMDTSRRKKINTNINVGIGLVSIFYIYLYMSGGINNTAFVWYFTYPMIACYLMGSRIGGLLTVAMLLPVIALTLANPVHSFFAQYSFIFVLRFVAAYVVVGTFSYLFERAREKNQVELKKINQSLEDLVAIRTSELVTANTKLQDEVDRRKQAQQAMRLTQEILATVLDSIDATIYAADLETYEILFMNKHMKEVFGRDMTGELCWQVFRNESGPCSHCSNPHLIDEHENLTGVHISEGKNPVTGIWYINYDRAVKWIDGRFVKLQIAFDISERKRVEKTLRESEERYRLLADNINDNIWILDIQTLRFSYVSPSVEKLNGYSTQEAIGLDLKDILTPTSLEVVTHVLGEELSRQGRNQDRTASRILELEQFHKNGATIWTEVSVRFIYDAKGQPISILGVTRDISDRKKLQIQLHQSQKMEAIGTLAGGIAHDFNNILSAIIGYTELALDDDENGPQLRGNLQQIYTAGKRARDLVKQILAFARQSEEKLRPVRVDAIITEVLKFVRSSIPTTIEIKDRIESHSTIMGNPTQIDQILMNLCTNAAQAMEDEGGILGVSLTEVLVNDDDPLENMNLGPGNYLRLEVSDTGTGIAPEIIDSIFEPYFTTKRPGEGTGMGLASVHGIVESYGGRITVDSSLGSGTRFEIHLPTIAEHKTQQPMQTEKLPSGKERILFVDDEAAITTMGSEALKRLGYTVTPRTSSIEALALFKSTPNDFDLVISDVTMPDMTGDILTGELMSIRPDIPVILCTGYSKRISDEMASELGIKAYAYKPIEMAELAKTVRKVLDEAKN